MPQPQPYKDNGNLRSWLQESDGCDQYAMIHKVDTTPSYNILTISILTMKGGEEVTVYSNTNPEPVEVASRARWNI